MRSLKFSGAEKENSKSSAIPPHPTPTPCPLCYCFLCHDIVLRVEIWEQSCPFLDEAETSWRNETKRNWGDALPIFSLRSEHPTLWNDDWTRGGGGVPWVKEPEYTQLAVGPRFSSLSSSWCTLNVAASFSLLIYLFTHLHYRLWVHIGVSKERRRAGSKHGEL